MTFKDDWEKKHTFVQIRDDSIMKMVSQAYPTARLLSHKIISGGCANLNIHLVFDNGKSFVLRIYLCDSSAALKEKNIASLLKGHIATPEILHIGHEDGYTFSIAEHIPGITLRDLLLHHPQEHDDRDIKYLMEKAGEILTIFHRFKFPKPGFFDDTLQVHSIFGRDNLITYVHECMDHDHVQTLLGIEKISKLQQIFRAYENLLPDDDPTLTHADYDPSNIIVDKVDGRWEITGILDWEFAFAGPWLCDVANMFRYTHHMPKIFEEAYIQGIENGGFSMPDYWKERVSLLNLISLLDCLKVCDPQERPHQLKDICMLINHTMPIFKHGDYS